MIRRAGTKRDRRRGRKHSRDSLPLGTIRVRWRGTHKSRYIKVAHGGTPNHRWKLYARWLWEQHNGSVPRGKRVGHLDGDTMNDSLENLAVMESGDIIVLAHIRDPEMSDRNHRAAARGTAEANRLRGRINRARNWCPTRWYPVSLSKRLIYNDPHKSRSGLLAAYGIAVTVAGDGSRRSGHRQIDKSPVLPVRGSELEVAGMVDGKVGGGRFAGFRKVAREGRVTQ